MIKESLMQKRTLKVMVIVVVIILLWKVVMKYSHFKECELENSIHLVISILNIERVAWPGSFFDLYKSTTPQLVRVQELCIERIGIF